MILLLCLLIFITSYVADRMSVCSRKIGEPLGIFEIFLAVANSAELCVLIPAVFLVLTGDFPKRDGNALLYVQRLGKYKWLIGQIFVAVCSILTYLAIILLGCMLMTGKNALFQNQWSKVVTDYAVTYPEDSTALVTKLLTGRLYNHFTPYQAAGYSISLLFGLLFFLSMIKIVFFLLGKTTMGMAVTAVLLVFGWVFSLLDIKVKWMLPLSHAIEWQHCDIVFRAMTVRMSESYLYFLGGSVASIWISILLLDRFDFG
jgi:hypothetical protein